MTQSTIDLYGRTYNVVTLDYETYYASDYTLSKDLNTSEYIRDDRFHVHGVAIKKGDGKTLWYTKENIALALAEIDWENTALIAHNMAFDGFITSEVYGHKPGLYLDTLSMARGAHGHHTRHNLDTIAKLHGLKGKVKGKALVDTKGKMDLTTEEIKNLGAYACDDVDDTFAIFWKMYPHLPDPELKLIDMTMRMFCDPVLDVDIPRVEAELKQELGKKAAALALSGATVEELMSNAKFAQLLLKEGATVPMKTSKSTGKQTYAFAKSDLDFKTLMEQSGPKIKALCEARLRVKSTIGETRAIRFLEAGKNGMKLPVLLNYSGAHTHRWSGGNKMNLQNLLRGGELRRSILAPKGHVIVVADSAQIEARVLAWLAGQMDIVNAFADKEDVYCLMASSIYGRTITKEDKLERFVGKVCVLGLGYGMGAEKFQYTLKAGALGPSVDLPIEECRQIVQAYRAKNSKIKAFWKRMDRIISAMTLGVPGQDGVLTYGKGYIQMPNDMFLQYYGLHGEVELVRDDIHMVETTYLTMKGRTKLYGGLLAENVTQALARIIIGEQMIKIDQAGYRVVTMSHDEIVVVCPEKDGQKCLDFMIETMSTAPDWAPGLPLSAEGGFDTCYSK